STFYISQKLGGNKTMLIGDAIEYLFNLGPAYYNVASSLSLILMFMILLCLAVMNHFTEDDGGVLL
ncbi:MAG: ABC transporter permease, partial [Clostridia bacterium]|nr:ABC transporter permease [Clostridia bacterium]